MPTTLERLIRDTVTFMTLGYRLVRGHDYQTLSQYMLTINKQRSIDALLHEVSVCLKDILDYDLFGFGLNRGPVIDLWIDPRAYSEHMAVHVQKDFNVQNIDCKVHYLDNISSKNSRNNDTFDVNKLISYTIIEGRYHAKLYLLPKKKILYHHDRIISTIIASIGIALEHNLNITELKNAVATDPLTKCYNRRALDRFLESDIAFAKRHRRDLAIIMFDIDNFKEINDRYGHQAGDAVLQELAAVAAGQFRRSDYLARYGGEEFVLVLRDSTLYQAVQLAHKLRKTIEDHAFFAAGRRIELSASFGIAGLENKPDGRQVLAEADFRLYRAKSIGKNTVVPSMLPCFADPRFLEGAGASARNRLVQTV